MKTLIIYESAFGNTRKIALAIQDALKPVSDVIALHPDEVQPSVIQGNDLIIVGSPTQKFSPLPGTSLFLKKLPEKSLSGKKVAAFDTRIDLKKINNRLLNFMVWIFGYAAEPIARKLKAKGGMLIAPAEGFFVDDTKGPVTEGELERAGAWGRQLAD